MVYPELPKAYDQLYQNGNLIEENNIFKMRTQTKQKIDDTLFPECTFNI